jgi:hypothetical protein
MGSIAEAGVSGGTGTLLVETGCSPWQPSNTMIRPKPRHELRILVLVIDITVSVAVTIPWWGWLERWKSDGHSHHFHELITLSIRRSGINHMTATRTYSRQAIHE